jgi:hypothetical protein
VQPGSDAANATDGTLWRHLQRASVGWQPLESLLLEAGLFLTSFGVEGLAVKDNWNWSRSNAFARLPNYQTGLKSTIHLDERMDLVGGIYNGWNSIVDNNDEKSMFLQWLYKRKDKLTVSASYYGGVERNGGAKEGRPWRHTAQTFAQASLHERIEAAVEADGGFEDNRRGVHWFAAFVAWWRVKIQDWLYLAGRGERIWEDPSADARGASERFLVPAKYVTSGTMTLDGRPTKGLSVRLEYRHDHARSAIFFRDRVSGDGGEAAPYAANATTQSTLLLGVVAWF